MGITSLAVLLAGCSGGGSGEPTASEAGSGEASSAAPAVETIEVPVPEDITSVEPLLRTTMGPVIEQTRRDPGNAGNWALLGMVYYANDYVDLAAACLEQSLAMVEINPHVWYYLARLRAELGDVDGALTAVDKSLEYSPNEWFLHWRRGFYLLDLGQLDEAEAAFARAEELNDHDPIGRIGLARVANQKGEYEKAEELLVNVLVGSHGDHHHPPPNPAWVRDLLGRVYRQMGRENDAIRYLSDKPIPSLVWNDPWNEDLVRKYRRKEDYIITQAHQMITTGKTEEAIAYLQPLVQIYPEDTTLDKLLAQAYYASGRSSKAIEMLEGVIAKTPEDFSAHLNLAFAYEVLEQWGDAERIAVKAVALNPENPDARVQHGRILYKSGDYQMAASILQECVQRYGEYAPAYMWLSQAQAQLGQNEEASASLAKAREIAPQHPELPMFEANVMAIQDGS